jgi:hypothetical protein
VIGKTDDLCMNVLEDKVHVHDLQATLLHCLGLDHTRLTHHHMGRDFRLTDVVGMWCGRCWREVGKDGRFAAEERHLRMK